MNKLTVFGKYSDNGAILVDVLDGVLHLQESAIGIESCRPSVVFVLKKTKLKFSQPTFGSYSPLLFVNQFYDE